VKGVLRREKEKERKKRNKRKKRKKRKKKGKERKGKREKNSPVGSLQKKEKEAAWKEDRRQGEDERSHSYLWLLFVCFENDQRRLRFLHFSLSGVKAQKKMFFSFFLFLSFFVLRTKSHEARKRKKEKGKRKKEKK